jgi:hypothetical protein
LAFALLKGVIIDPVLITVLPGSTDSSLTTISTAIALVLALFGINVDEAMLEVFIETNIPSNENRYD